MIKNQRRFTYRHCDSVGKPIACLSVHGKFLAKYGFDVGTKVDIHYSDGLVHIKKILQNRYGDKFNIK